MGTTPLDPREYVNGARSRTQTSSGALDLKLPLKRCPDITGGCLIGLVSLSHTDALTPVRRGGKYYIASSPIDQFIGWPKANERTDWVVLNCRKLPAALIADGTPKWLRWLHSINVTSPTYSSRHSLNRNATKLAAFTRLLQTRLNH